MPQSTEHMIKAQCKAIADAYDKAHTELEKLQYCLLVRGQCVEATGVEEILRKFEYFEKEWWDVYHRAPRT